MAGLYSVWRGQDGTPVYNYTILTRESNSVLSWLHHRMPCFLSQHQAQFWLDPLLPVHEALGLLKVPSESDLSWHTVSLEIGNVKNQSFDLLKKVDPVEEKKKENTSKASQTLMSNWLKRSNNSPSSQPLKKK
ncbi:embryonic stem cell-specific 5-hydroxymethylcytosine-binding protein-like [Eurytemora carolleeae]|uniref:embryonic stem cell-specific 5-hydroxymethylcytosine-binding protein-like n=1 Tax=Eurytemora carolleeae TaxID=1294199 RepID=UPI000C756341|nr:embryonic stem cell-specific 5-hydroxymethylcytosine-binding protein-like [Eurytemora carolleeae]|eukprot:XP_023343588.1 embryonic stem cell-specific 5-hydroxymethylcytosine-binding protein-like [Eurytemora affinis]